MTDDLKLDTLQGCTAALTQLNQDVAGFASDWARDAGELATLQKRYDRMYKEAMRTTKGSNADERTALAHAAAEEAYRKLNGLDDDQPGLSERIEDLIGRVESHKRMMETIDRRSGNVQSILRARREEHRLDPYVADAPPTAP